MRASKHGVAIASLVCLLLGSTAFGAEKEQKNAASLDRLPAPALKTARKQTAGALVRSVSKEVEDGRTVYEIETTVNGHGRDMIIAADGTLMVVETEMVLDSLAAVVRSSIVEHAGRAKIVRVESVELTGTLSHYEALVRTGRRESEIKVRPDGQLFIEPAEAAKPADAGRKPTQGSR